MILLQVHLQQPCYDFCLVKDMVIGDLRTKEVIATVKLQTTHDPPNPSDDVPFLATAGGVYKRQGHIQSALMKRAY